MGPTLTRPTNAARSALPVGVAVVLAWLIIGSGFVWLGGAFTNDGIAVPVGIGSAAPARSFVVLPCVEGWSLDGASGCGPAVSPDEWPGGAPLPVVPADSGSELVAWVDSSQVSGVTAVLASSQVGAGLLAAGVAMLLLLPVIRSTADGRPFADGNARRWAAATVVAAVGWGLGTVGPYLAARRVIPVLEANPVHRTVAGEVFTLPTGWLVAAMPFAAWPLLVVALLGVLAAATHRGARLAADAEGLV